MTVDQGGTNTADTLTYSVRGVSAADLGEAAVREAIRAGATDAAALVTTFGDDDGNFSINQRTGQLSLKAALDFEGRAEDDGKYVVVVSAIDPSNDSGSPAYDGKTQLW